MDVTLTLKDFESDASPPAWLPEHVWRDVMAISVLPGPLEFFCTQIAEDPDTWQNWFESETNDVPLPLEMPKDGDSPLTGFHTAMVLRVLRPDLLLPYFQDFVVKFFPSLSKNTILRYSEIQPLLGCGFNGVLVLLPTDARSEKYHHSAFCPYENPVKVLQDVAKASSLIFFYSVLLTTDKCECSSLNTFLVMFYFDDAHYSTVVCGVH